MAPSLALPIAAFFCFILLTVCFYLLPRTIGGLAVFLALVVHADLVLRTFGSVDLAGAIVALVLFTWFVPGVIIDIAHFKRRLSEIEDRILNSI